MTDQLTPAEIRLAQYGQRTSTWSTATYNDGTEKALHEIALGLKAEVDRLRAEVAAARQQAIGWAADQVDAKLTAEPDHNRASVLYELLLHLRGELPCICARSWGLHEQTCRKYVPGHDLLSPVLALNAYRAERAAVRSDAV